MHARPPKHLKERFDWYAEAIASNPAALKGSWLQERMPQAAALHLDLGCGKGEWTCASAKKHPGDLWVGLDNEEICIAMSAKKAVVEDQIPNVVFGLAKADDILELFQPGEVDVLHLNFSTPCPRAKHAPLRLTHADRLNAYRTILAEDGRIELKTDSQPLYDWTLEQLRVAGYRVAWQTRDLHGMDENAHSPIDPALSSGYELRTGKLGAKVHALVAVPAQQPEQLDQTGVAQSLTAYLPEDLDSLEYIPYGMEEYVENVRNRRAKMKGRVRP